MADTQPELDVNERKKKEAMEKKQQAMEKKQQEKMNDVLAEGSKKGSNISGLFKEGGVEFFQFTSDVPGEDWEMMGKFMEGLNTQAENIGKIVLSAGNKKVILYCHVPKNLQEREKKSCNMKEWLSAVMKTIEGKITEETDEYIKAEAVKDPKDERHPTKLRDEAFSQGFPYLRKVGLIPEEDSDDECAFTFDE